jgi:N-acetylmuramoyl-L-alanine amidase
MRGTSTSIAREATQTSRWKADRFSSGVSENEGAQSAKVSISEKLKHVIASLLDQLPAEARRIRHPSLFFCINPPQPFVLLPLSPVQLEL